MTKNLAEVMNDAEGASKEAINRAEATRREFAEISLYKRADRCSRDTVTSDGGDELVQNTIQDTIRAIGDTQHQLWSCLSGRYSPEPLELLSRAEYTISYDACRIWAEGHYFDPVLYEKEDSDPTKFSESDS